MEIFGTIFVVLLGIVFGAGVIPKLKSGSYRILFVLVATGLVFAIAFYVGGSIAENRITSQIDRAVTGAEAGAEVLVTGPATVASSLPQMMLIPVTMMIWGICASLLWLAGLAAGTVAKRRQTEADMA